MRKYIWFIAITVVAFFISIRSDAQIQYGIRAGGNFSNAVLKEAEGNKMPTNLLPGFHVAATTEIPVMAELSLRPELVFNAKGYAIKQVSDGVEVKLNINAYYLELPVNVIYKPSLGNGHLLLGGGPFLAYGVGGRWKVTGANDDYNFSTTGNVVFANNFSSSDSSLINTNLKGDYPYGKPLDFGLSLLAGYEFSKRIYFQINGQLGLLNFAPELDDQKTGEKGKNLQFGISVGYKFK